MHIYRRTGSYNATLVERHGFQEKTAYCVRIPGGILTLFNPQTHLKKSGTAFSDFSVFWRCVHYFSVIFIILKMCFIDFSLFWRCFSLFSMGFMILRSFWLLSIIVHWFFIIVHWFFIIFKTLLIIFMDVSLFLRCVSLFFIDFSMLLHVFHWFFSVLKAFFMIFHYVLGFLQFTCIFCIFAVPYTWKTREGRECVKNFGVLGVSGLNK